MGRREKLEALLAESPQDSFLRYALALEFVSAGEDRQAVSHLESLAGLDPGYVPTYLQLAQIQVRLGESDSARPVLLRGLEAARRAGDQHAEDELRGLLDQITSSP